jgi:hypothetical protein
LRKFARGAAGAARWIAPSTPPPPSSERFAALTMASTASVVISATTTLSRAGPAAAVSMGVASRFIGSSITSRELRLCRETVGPGRLELLHEAWEGSL